MVNWIDNWTANGDVSTLGGKSNSTSQTKEHLGGDTVRRNNAHPRFGDSNRLHHTINHLKYLRPFQENKFSKVHARIGSIDTNHFSNPASR